MVAVSLQQQWYSNWDKRLLWAVLVSIFLHIILFVLIGINKDHPPQHKIKKTPKMMDVVLFKQPKKKSVKKNRHATTIANQSIIGANKPLHDQVDRMARVPVVMPQPTPPRPAPRVPPQPVPQPKRPQPAKKTAPPTIHRKAPSKRNSVSHQVKREKKPKLRPIPLTQLMASSLPFAQQSPHRDRTRAKPSLRREANIPINTREEKYAPYAHALVNALEEQWRPGQANYDQHPEQDRQVLLKLSIDRDGSLVAIEILRPSPIDALNASAIQAIHDASPFRPLPSAWGLDRASFFLTFEVVDDRFVFRGM